MPMFVEIQFLKLFTKLGIMLNIPKLSEAELLRYRQLGLGMLRMIKFGMLLEKHSLQYMKLSKILFFCEIHATRALDKVSEALDAIEEVTEAVLSGCRYSVAVADKIEIIRVVIGQHHFWSWS